MADAGIVKIHADIGILVHIPYAETDRQIIPDMIGSDGDGHGVAHASLCLDGDLSAAVGGMLTACVARGGHACFCRLFRYKVHEVVHVQDIAASKNALDVGLQALVDDRAARHGIEPHACGGAQLILGNQPAGQEQGIAGVALLGALDRLAVGADLGDGHGGDMLLALDIHNRV